MKLNQKMKLSMKKSNIRLANPVFVNLNACDGCGMCVDVCPAQLFEIKELTLKEISELSFIGKLKVRIKGKAKSYAAKPNECIECGKCVSSCHEHAITVRNLKKRA